MDNLVIEKIIMPISECIPGMTLMQSIVDMHTGAIIVGKGHVLTKESIEKLKNFEHSQVWISTQTEASIWKVEREVFEQYKEYTSVLQVMLQDVGNQSLLSVDNLKKLVEKIVIDFSDEYHVLGCINLLNEFEEDAYEHSIKVAFLSMVMGRWKGYDKDKLKELVLAALLHDVGKILLPPYMRNKSEKDMNTVEKLEYRRHPIYGYEKLASYNEMSVATLKGVLSHHERCDGSGYPLSIREDKINDIAKIIGITDTYFYLKNRYHIFEVVRRLGNIMIRKFDVSMLFEFCNNIINYYVGASVLLNTGEVGEVLFIQPQAWGRPIVRVKGRDINLYEKVQLEIIKVF